MLVTFDTSGERGSVAVGRGDEVLACVELAEPRAHARLLVPGIEHALVDAALARTDIDGIVVGEGPGSFTGVRVAAATAKGLVHALGVPLWAGSSLAAAALAHDVGRIRYVLFDARGDRVYGACYGIGTAGFQELVAPHGGALREALSRDVPPGAVFLGDGAERHRAAIEGAGFAVSSEPTGLLAVGLLQYLSACPTTLPVSDPGRWEPAYVRAASAERLWTA